MRAREFICERAITKTGVKPRPDHEAVMPSAHRVAGTDDRTYNLNRIMMAAAAADGKTRPSLPNQSWVGTNNVATPYTTLERDMLHHAYEAVGAEWDDVLKPNVDQKSLEPDYVHKQSPVPKRKKNRYGV